MIGSSDGADHGVHQNHCTSQAQPRDHCVALTRRYCGIPVMRPQVHGFRSTTPGADPVGTLSL